MTITTRQWPSPLISGLGLISLVALTGCSGTALVTSEQRSQTRSTDAVSEVSQPTAEVATAAPVPAIATGSPQLIKQASLQMTLADIEAVINTLSQDLSRYQGEVLSLSDHQPDTHQPRQVQIRLRVPQEQFDALLEHLRSLGTVETQSITAEDVAEQLVDLQARIRNLRRSEDMLLRLMERSGSIADVLEVSQELSSVRETIERLEAQRSHLQTQVTYATVDLTLVSRQPVAAPVPSMQEVLAQTWQTATQTLRSLSLALLKLVLWLLVFSPYWGMLLLATWAGHRYWQQHRLSSTPERE